MYRAPNLPCACERSSHCLDLAKIGTVIVRNMRRIRLLISSAFPYQFAQAAYVRQI